MKNKLGILGYPLGHSLSPVMHEAGLKAAGMDLSYDKIEANYYELQEAMHHIKETYLGFNVTIPYKEKIMPWIDQVWPEARAAGAVNTVRIDKGRLLGTNTDGKGYLRSLRERGIDPLGRRFLILGSGGAARGVATALVSAKAASIDLASRKKNKGHNLLEILAVVGSAGGSWLDLKTLADKDLSAYDIIINATPVGMAPRDKDCLDLPFDSLRKGQILSDLIYQPRQTRFLQEGQARGLTLINGLDMLLYQGAESFEFWFDQPAPIQAMRQALEDRLGELDED